jgi:hypothetical protein
LGFGNAPGDVPRTVETSSTQRHPLPLTLRETRDGEARRRGAVGDRAADAERHECERRQQAREIAAQFYPWTARPS